MHFFAFKISILLVFIPSILCPVFANQRDNTGFVATAKNQPQVKPQAQRRQKDLIAEFLEGIKQTESANQIGSTDPNTISNSESKSDPIAQLLEEYSPKKTTSNKCSTNSPYQSNSKFISSGEINNDLFLQSIQKIDEKLESAEAQDKKKYRYKGNCLRAMKYALCVAHDEISVKDILGENGAQRPCPYLSDGSKNNQYPGGGHAVDFPKYLSTKENWVDITCGGQIPVSIKDSPPGAILCYKAMDLNNTKDKNRNSGHCEVKVDNCKFCFDGCLPWPRTGSIDQNENAKANRKLFSVMIRHREHRNTNEYCQKEHNLTVMNWDPEVKNAWEPKVKNNWNATVRSTPKQRSPGNQNINPQVTPVDKSTQQQQLR